MAYEYLLKAAGTWFMGFFPLAEIYIAIPAGMAIGLDDLSVIFWAVFGNFTPVLLIHYGYEQLIRIERVRAWFARLVTERVKARVNRYGAAVVLVLTPWVGVWGMALTAKALQMHAGRFALSAFVSITVYAIALVLLINLGIAELTG